VWLIADQTSIGKLMAQLLILHNLQEQGHQLQKRSLLLVKNHLEQIHV
jgi:hypothetical protein